MLIHPNSPLCASDEKRKMKISNHSKLTERRPKLEKKGKKGYENVTKVIREAKKHSSAIAFRNDIAVDTFHSS